MLSYLIILYDVILIYVYIMRIYIYPFICVFGLLGEAETRVRNYFVMQINIQETMTQSLSNLVAQDVQAAKMVRC